MLARRRGRAVTATPGPAGRVERVQAARPLPVPGPPRQAGARGRRRRSLRLRKGSASGFRFVAAKGCTALPRGGARCDGRRSRGTNPNGTVFGFADTHLHITAEPACRRAGHRRRALRPLRDHRGSRARRGRPRPRRQRRRHRQPAAHRPAVRHPRHRTAGRRSRAGRSTTRTPISRSITRGSSGPTTPGCGWWSPRPSRTSRSAGSSRCARTPATRRTRSSSRSAQLEGLQDYVDAQSGGPGRGWFRLVYNPTPGAAGDRAGQARGRDRGRVLGPVRLLGARRLRPRRRRPRPRRAPPARGPHLFIAHWVDNAFAGSALEGGTQGRLHQHLQPGRDRPLLQHRPLPRPEPGRGGGHARAGRDADPRPVLPGRRRHPADAGLPRGQAVQLQGPDEARRLSGPADDRRRTC